MQNNVCIYSYPPKNSQHCHLLVLTLPCQVQMNQTQVSVIEEIILVRLIGLVIDDWISAHLQARCEIIRLPTAHDKILFHTSRTIKNHYNKIIGNFDRIGLNNWIRLMWLCFWLFAYIFHIFIYISMYQYWFQPYSSAVSCINSRSKEVLMKGAHLSSSL